MVEAQATKVCTKCKACKPIDQFSRRTKSKSGRKPSCKQCVAAYNATPAVVARLKAKHLEVYGTVEGRAKAIARVTAYRATPGGRAKRAASLAAYLASPEGRAKVKAGYAARYATPEGRAKQKAKHDAYVATPKGRANEKARLKKFMAKDGRASFKVIQARFRATPAGRAAGRRNTIKRRARKAGAAVGDLQLITAWEATWRTAKSVPCHWCGKKFPGKDCHSDHRLALSKGGAHDVENLVVACEKCNLKKGDTHPADFNATLEQPLLFF